MRLVLRTTLVIAIALACATPAHARQAIPKPPITWLKGEGNYTKAHRSPRSIRNVVVHVTEGPFWSSIRWLKNEHAHASAHYVVGRNGRIVQLVHTSDIAWHAGNWKINEQSIGIEHEGMTFDPVGFTRPQYEASARLTAWIARLALMPIDRKHVIGHDEVPHPSRPGVYGGASAHQDPGPNWRWPSYLRLVRKFAYPPKPLKVSSSVARGRRIGGIVPWRAETSRNVARVDFVVDGRVLWSDRRKPFAFLGGRGLNTVGLGNGRHVLELRAHGGGRVKRAYVPVVVSNKRFDVTTAGARPWSVARGVVKLRARVWNAKPKAVSLRVDGKRVAFDRRWPYVFWWDSRKAKPGKHVLLLTATALDGRVVRRRIPLVVRPPAAPAAPALAVSGQTPDGSEPVEGFVLWSADVAGAPERVEFWIDGVLRGTDVRRPFTFGWNAADEEPGEHRLEVRALAGERVASRETVVTVAAPAPSP